MSANKNILIRLWSGEVALIKTYWLWGVLVNIVLSFVIGMAPLINQTLAIIISAFAVIYAIFISVAIWKSATRYEGKSLWKYLAKIAVILPLIGIIVSLILPNLSVTSTYQSSSECMFKELKKSEQQNVQLAVNNIANYCHVKVIENLKEEINSKVNIKQILDEGATYQQISEAFFMQLIEKKQYPKREKYTKISECIVDLSRGANGPKEKELLLDAFAKAYCYELVTINLGDKNGYDIYSARKEGYSFKEIAEYLEFGKK